MAQNKKEIIENIVNKLYKEDLLNETDYPDHDTLYKVVSEIISEELDNYLIISGNIL